MDKPKSKKRPWDGIRRKQPGQPMENRSRNEFYHTSRWKRESRVFRQEHPLCSGCRKKGLIVPSEVTDHIVPLELCADPWDHENWDGLCRKCNNTKAAADKKLIQQHRKNNPK
jgi:5-methylcytosine-specific restriction enzyme A